jgi:2-polyprenyl-3-methyl-5-hydroxy-6-metoxy-1,4-benzoquinol methylase
MTDIAATIKYYDALAERSFAEWFDNDALLPSLKDFVSLLGNNPAVLDLGCGTGGESKRMLGLGARVVGVDLSGRSIEFARNNVPEAQFLEMNILELQFEHESFDGVMEAGVLFHFPRAEQDKILGDIHTMLKNRGVFQSYYPEGSTEGYEHPTIDGTGYSRYARRLAKDEWIRQVEGKGLVFRKEVPFTTGRFKCLQFQKK